MAEKRSIDVDLTWRTGANTIEFDLITLLGKRSWESVPIGTVGGPRPLRFQRDGFLRKDGWDFDRALDEVRSLVGKQLAMHRWDEPDGSDSEAATEAHRILGAWLVRETPGVEHG